MANVHDAKKPEETAGETELSEQELGQVAGGVGTAPLSCFGFGGSPTLRPRFEDPTFRKGFEDPTFVKGFEDPTFRKG